VFHRAARLAIVVCVALYVRAADAQQFYPSGQRSDPYSPQSAPPQSAPRLPPVATPPAVPQAPNTALRYPLPPGPGTASQPSPAAAQRSISDLPTRPGKAVTATALVQPTTPPANPFKAGEIVAVVGDKFIFYGDVAPLVDQTIGEALLKAKSTEERERYLAAREALMRGATKQLVDIKMKYLAFERELQKNIPDAKKREDKKREIDKNIRASFEKALAEMRTKVEKADPEQLQKLSQRDIILPRLATLMHDHGAESYAELDALLRGYGTTLDKQTRLFIEDILGREMLRKHMNMHPDVTHEEMLDYYRQHVADYAVPAKAQFEILTVKWSSFPTRDEARNQLAMMGNEVVFGAPFSAVAAKHSQEPNAKEGGRYDVSQGSLASPTIDQAVFAIEVGKLSQIIEDDAGCHIIRVIARQPAGQVPFLEAQEKIKETIRVNKLNNDYRKFLETLVARTEVWTIYDPPVVAQQPSETIQR